MDPIGVADVVLKIGEGVFAVLFSAAFGVSIIPMKKSHNFPGRCVAYSYEDFSIVASVLVSFAAVSVLSACIIKYIYRRATEGNPGANLVIARRLICVLVPSASVSYILAFVLFVMVNQYRLGKIGCWSLTAQVFIFGACIFAGIAGFIIGVIGYRYGRDLDGDSQFFTPALSLTVTRERSLDAVAATSTDVEAATQAEEGTQAAAPIIEATEEADDITEEADDI